MYAINLNECHLHVFFTFQIGILDHQELRVKWDVDMCEEIIQRSYWICKY
jgi:hypothetical protein